LGILAGEQIVPIAKRLIAGERLSFGWLKSECGERVFGALPTKLTERQKDTATGRYGS
jgi:xanthosine utilization system XapX-like protein